MIAGKKNQTGFTTLEIILVIALAGILGVGITTFITQTITESSRSNDHMQTIMQVENAGFWVSRDVQMAQNLTMGANAGFPLQLFWTDADQNIYQVTYSLSEDQIERSVIKNGEEFSRTLIAESVNSTPTLTFCDYAGGLVTFNVTATIGNNNISRTYQIKKRLDLL